MNTFVVFASRVIGYVVDRMVLRNESDAPGIGYYLTTIVLDIALGFLAAIVVVVLAPARIPRGRRRCCADGYESPDDQCAGTTWRTRPWSLPQQVQTFAINGRPSGMLALFSSHPPIEERIAAPRRDSQRCCVMNRAGPTRAAQLCVTPSWLAMPTRSLRC